MAKRSIKKQRGRGQAQSAPQEPQEAPPSLIEVIRSDEEDPEIKSGNILDAIRRGADINERDEDGSSPLIELMIHTNQDGTEWMYYDVIIRELIGNDINYVGPEGSALHYAILNIQEEYIERLLQLGANVNIRNNKGETPLFIASLNFDLFTIC
jgi:ankyrin repeat protein